MSEEADIIDIDQETLTLLRETGIDPQVYLKRRAELRAWRRTPEEEAKLAAEREEFREAIAWYNDLIERQGSLSDALRDA